METWVMRVRVGSMGPISRSTTTINSLYNIAGGIVYGIFRHRSTSTIINTDILPHVTIIATYISPPVTIIATDIPPLSAMTTISYSLIPMNILVNRTRRIWWTKQYNTSTWVMGVRVAGLVLILWCNNTNSFRLYQISINGLRSKISHFFTSYTRISSSIIQ